MGMRIIELRCPECRKTEFIRCKERWHPLTWVWCQSCIRAEEKAQEEDREIKRKEALKREMPEQPVTNFTTIKEFSALQVSKK